MKTYRTLLVSAAVFVFFSNLPLYLYEEMGVSFFEAPKHWWLGFCLLVAPCLLWRTPGRLAWRSPLLMWCLLFLWATIIGFFLSSQSDTAWQEVRWRFQTVSVLVVLYLVLSDAALLALARRALAVGVLFGVAMNVYELLVAPLSWEYVVGRSAGLYINANTSAECLVLGMILSVTILPTMLRLPFILVTGVGVMLTVSRAGVLAWIVAVGGLLVSKQVRAKDLVMSAFVGVTLAVLVVLPRLDDFLTVLDQKGLFNANVLERLEWFVNPTGVEDYSSWERRTLAAQAWEKISARPATGHGTGSYLESVIPPHNQYLALMTDHGLLGVLILPLLVLAVIWGTPPHQRLVGAIFATAVLLFCFTTHSILYRENSLLLFAMMAAIAATHRVPKPHSLSVRAGARQWEWIPQTAR